MTYAPYDGINHPPLGGPVPVPSDDAEAVHLIHRTKAALDYNDAAHARVHPAVKAAFLSKRSQHVDNVVGAIHKFHSENPSPMSQQIIDAIHSDPNIKTSHSKPPAYKP